MSIIKINIRILQFLLLDFLLDKNKFKIPVELNKNSQ